jgi:branched-chain amino acid transport system substrate-binding protein
MRRLGALGVVVSCAAGVVACGSEDESPSSNQGSAATQSKEPIKLPVIYSSTGAAGGFGQIAKAGFDMAVAEVNEGGGINGRKLELDYQDDATDPTKAVRLTEDAVKTDAPVVIGPILSASATAGLPRCVAAKVACIATIAGNAPAIRDAAPWGFTFIQPGDVIASKGTELFLAANQATKFAQVIDKSNPSMVLQASGFEAAAKKAGKEVLAPQYINAQGVDFRAQATKVKAQSPDAVYVAVLDSASPGVVKALRQQGVDAPILGSTAAVSGNFLKAAGKSAEGVYGYAELWTTDPAIADWTTKVKAAGGIADTVDSAAYDTIKMLAEVLGSVDLNGDTSAVRQKVQEAIHAVEFKGVSSTYKWDDKGIPTKVTYLVQVKDGTFDKVGSG